MSVRVKAHTRGAPDPLTPHIEAKRRRFQSKWGIAMVSANDERLAAPIPDPVQAPTRAGIISSFMPWAWRRK